MSTPAPAYPQLQADPVLVTGASGFIGAHLCRRLQTDGHRVIATGRSHPEWLPSGTEHRNVELADPAAVEALIRDTRPAAIFHLASCVKGSRDRALVRPTFDANLAASVYLMEAAAESGCGRFVLTGSLEEPDDARTAPSSPYAAAKAAATAYARMYHALYAFPAVIARLFMVYGPGQRDRAKLVPYVIDSLLAGTAPRLSSGTRPVDWIFVDDVVEGLIRLAATETTPGRTVDLGSGTLATVREVVERLSRQIDPDIPLRFDPAADRPMEQVRVADAEATEALLGWRPSTPLDAGLAATIDWHREHPAG